MLDEIADGELLRELGTRRRRRERQLLMVDRILRHPLAEALVGDGRVATLAEIPVELLDIRPEIGLLRAPEPHAVAPDVREHLRALLFGERVLDEDAHGPLKRLGGMSARRHDGEEPPFAQRLLEGVVARTRLLTMLDPLQRRNRVLNEMRRVGSVFEVAERLVPHAARRPIVHRVATDDRERRRRDLDGLPRAIVL